MKRVLVTGGSGKLGKFVVAHLSQQDGQSQAQIECLILTIG